MSPGKGAGSGRPGTTGILATVAMAAVMATTAIAAFGQTAAATVGAGAVQAAPTTVPAAMSEGEVRKIDRDAGKITIRHGPIATLDMPGMTMVFRVSEPAMLDGLKEGTRVRFVADRVGGVLTVTQIESAS